MCTGLLKSMSPAGSLIAKNPLMAVSPVGGLLFGNKGSTSKPKMPLQVGTVPTGGTGYGG